MSEGDPQIARLEERLDSLVRTQVDFQLEITAIRRELTRLRNLGEPTNRLDRPVQETPPVMQTMRPAYTPPPSRPVVPATPIAPPTFGMKAEPSSGGGGARSSFFQDYIDDYSENAKANLEKFIGENLISKIGIIVLVLGVGIGAKYAIDNGWISPLMRIIFG